MYTHTAHVLLLLLLLLLSLGTTRYALGSEVRLLSFPLRSISYAAPFVLLGLVLAGITSWL